MTDLPPDYGNWSNPHRRFIRRQNEEAWEKLLEVLIDEPNHKWRMMGTTLQSTFACDGVAAQLLKKGYPARGYQHYTSTGQSHLSIHTGTEVLV